MLRDISGIFAATVIKPVKYRFLFISGTTEVAPKFNQDFYTKNSIKILVVLTHILKISYQKFFRKKTGNISMLVIRKKSFNSNECFLHSRIKTKMEKNKNRDTFVLSFSVPERKKKSSEPEKKPAKPMIPAIMQKLRTTRDRH